MEGDEKFALGFVIGLLLGVMLASMLKGGVLGVGGDSGGVIFERDENGRIVGIFTVPIKKGGNG